MERVDPRYLLIIILRKKIKRIIISSDKLH